MTKRRPVTLFALATLAPVPLLATGGTVGGAWVVLALAYMTVFTFVLDQLVATVTPNAPEGTEFPAADGLSVLLALAHFALLAVGIRAVSGAGGLAGWERVAAFFAFGLFFGQVSNSNAHELIHRPGRMLSRLGMWVYISLLFGHHSSAHPRVHHRFVATPDDPNTARLGESYYHFAPRAWAGSFREGLRTETALLRMREAPRWRHPYVVYVGGGLALLAASAAAFGIPGLIAHAGLAAYATSQLLLADYVQHYGLVRARMPNGRHAPVEARHSWNAPHWFSAFLMLNAPRHSDHHAHPTRKFPALQLPDPGAAPMLPLSLPAMATVALFPSAWRRMMDRRAREWLDRAA